MELGKIRVAQDGSHHVLDGRPLYPQRYGWVLGFHPPGLAAAADHTGAFHIRLDGNPAYKQRFIRTFGFYDERAAVQTAEGWGHIAPSGSLVYRPSFEWVGNFQEQRCPVRARGGRFYHILRDGMPAHTATWRYAGDYRDGVACVQKDNGLYTHIGLQGRLVHGKEFFDLDVYHKGLARARDNRGWHHIDIHGVPAYARRFMSVEPFYNGYARVEDASGALLFIDERGRTVHTLRAARGGIS